MALKDLILILVFTIIYSEGHRHKLKASMYLRRRQNECIYKTRVDPGIILRIRHGNWKNSNKAKVKNWALCVLEKEGLMSKEGVYKLDVAMAKIPKSEHTQFDNLIDKCLSKKPLPPPDIAYNFMKCFQRTLLDRSGNLCGL